MMSTIAVKMEEQRNYAINIGLVSYNKSQRIEVLSSSERRDIEPTLTYLSSVEKRGGSANRNGSLCIIARVEKFNFVKRKEDPSFPPNVSVRSLYKLRNMGEFIFREFSG